MVNLKEIVDRALQICQKSSKKHLVSHCVVVKHLTGESYSGEESARPGKRPCEDVKVNINVELIVGAGMVAVVMVLV